MRNAALGGLRPEDARFLDSLVTDYGPRLLAYVRHIDRNPQDAEDVVAEVFCRAAHNMAGLRRTNRPDLYLIAAARNLCRDRLRRRSTSQLTDGAYRDCVDSAVRPHHAAEYAEQLELLRAAVCELPESLRDVVVLGLSTGLRFEDIAELLNVPLGTALSRMHIAVEQLRAKLGVSV